MKILKRLEFISLMAVATLLTFATAGQVQAAGATKEAIAQLGPKAPLDVEAREWVEGFVEER